MLVVSLLVLEICIALEQSTTAQTRLGLHVTQEELNIWKQRAQSGPYSRQAMLVPILLGTGLTSYRRRMNFFRIRPLIVGMDRRQTPVLFRISSFLRLAHRPSGKDWLR